MRFRQMTVGALLSRLSLLRRARLGATVAACLALTLAVVGVERAGALDGLERWLYDQRVARCQFFMPPPTDRLLHLDIDDAALKSIQRWPWDRAIVAEVLDEIGRAGPAAVGLDLLFAEPQPPTWRPRGDGTFEQVDHDALLAASIRRLGNVLVPASFGFPVDAPASRFADVRDALTADLELDEEGVAAALARLDGEAVPTAAHRRAATDAYVGARAIAMDERLRRELDADATLDEPSLRARLLPRGGRGRYGPATRLLGVELVRVRADLAMRRFARPPARGEALLDARLNIAPIPPLIEAAAATGFVDYPQSVDGRVRAVPLFVRAGDRVYPQMGLALACLTMGVPPGEVIDRSDGVTVPRPGRDPLFVPTRTLEPRELETVREPVPAAIDLPWFGGAEWKRMYAHGGAGGGEVDQRTPQHLPIVKVWDACATRARIERNDAEIDAALRSMFANLDRRGDVERLDADPLPPGDWQSRVARVATAAAEVAEDVQFLRDEVAQEAAREVASPATAPSESDRDDLARARAALASFDVLAPLAAEAPRLAAQLAADRTLLRDAIDGRAVLVGWTASASIADFVSTPLHARCPGPVLHGVVFNAIMNGEVWRRAPAYVAPLVTLAAGLAATACVVRLRPSRGLAAVAALLAGYALGNGVALFDYGNLIVGAAGPLAAIALVWAGGTLAQLVLERRHRALIRRRFRTYVDPRLVEYVEKHPGRAAFDGERREMSVVFTDIAGFTQLTEALGEQTVSLLNELWARVVPVIRRDGYLNKFLGDGVMFFYGAPEPDVRHAAHAVAAALELRGLMRAFNAEVTGPRGLPPLGMRVGVSTGPMIVGDAGAGAAASDYTVLGDNVNLGARLEGAGKYFGLDNLMTARTAELAADQYLFRPIANLRVVGKRRGAPTCEAIRALDEATEHDHACARLTTAMVEAYQAQRFDACLAAADGLDAACGPTTLTARYRAIAEACRRSGPCDTFDPSITLETK